MRPLVLERRLERIKEVLKRRQKDLVLFVDDVKNEHNFSALIRTCDAVGVLRIYYFHEGGKEVPVNESVSVGSERWVFLERVEDKVSKLKELKDQGFQIVVTWISEESEDFRRVDYTVPTVIVVGNELKGVSEEILPLADRKVKIPMFGMARSLNVSVATGVILYEAERQREEKGMYEKPSLSEEEMERIMERWAFEDVIRRRKG